MKAINSDVERLEEMENSVTIDAIYIFDKCKEVLDGKYGKGYSEKHPELTAALVNSATNIFIHKPRKK